MAGGISIQVAIDGVTEVVAKFQAVAYGLQGAVAEAALGAAQDAKDTADPLTPVDTGFLKSRNQVRMASEGGDIVSAEYFNDAEYCRWVVWGHHSRSGSWVPGQDFMTPAFMAGEKSLAERLSRIPLEMFG